MAEWKIGKSLPISLEARSFGFTAMDQYVYLIGGKLYNQSQYNTNVYIYNISLNEWSIKTTVPVGLRINAAIAVGEKIYCLGNSLRNNIYSYDPMENKWQSKSSYISYPENPSVYQNFCVAVGTKIYCFPYPSDYDIAIYDTVLDQWSSAGRLPSVRAAFGIASVASIIYVFGGYVSIYNTTPLNTVDSFDTNSNTWSQLSAMVTGKTHFASGVSRTEIYAVAGHINTGETADTQIYSTLENSWRVGLGAPFSQDNVDCCYDSNGKMFFTAGSWLSDKFFILDTQTATITNPSPSAGFVDEKIANTFVWTLDSNIANATQKSAVFQWRVRNASTIRSINVGSTQSVIVPANTFPNGEIEWRVSATNTAGIVAPYTEWFLLTTIDERPGKPYGLFPSSGSRDGTKAIRFSWLHNSPLSTPQSAFELQISYDGGTSWKILSGKVTTHLTQFTAAANTIVPTDTAGRVNWRVRTYNSDNIASDWSDAVSFIVHPAPQTPSWISVETGKSRPLCNWTSLGQVGFQLQVLSGNSVLFDSGETYGTSTEYRIPDYLPNGVFNFQVRIKNIRQLFSDWATRTVTINARRSLNIILRGEAIENGARLEFDAEVKI